MALSSLSKLFYKYLRNFSFVPVWQRVSRSPRSSHRGCQTQNVILSNSSLACRKDRSQFGTLACPYAQKKLTLLNCEVLIQQVKRKFNSWSVRALSFAGRLLLIKTVIAGITNFWCSSFMLPKACIKRINSLCGVFLEIWNKACILKLIWLLFFEAGLIWVAWCTETVLNGDLNSFAYGPITGQLLAV